MLKLIPIATNVTELKNDNITILFSYQTPVAAYSLSPDWYERFGCAFIVTSTKHSATTSRHINKWLNGARGASVLQGVLDDILELSSIATPSV